MPSPGSRLAQELELVERERTRASHLRRRVRRRELHLVAVVVAELEQRRPDDEARGTLHEPAPIGAAAKFAVGHDLQADLFLHAHGFADALVLDRARTHRLRSPRSHAALKA